MSTEPAPAYRWLKAEHVDLAFWRIHSPLPWPAEDQTKIDPKRAFPFAKLLEGIRRLRADGKRWKEEWGAVETFLQRGEALNDVLEESDFTGALRMLDELERLRPDTAYCAFNRAFILRARGDKAGALSAATAATDRAPKLEYVWMRRGDLHEELGQEKDAIFCFRKALALLPNHKQALEGLSRLGAMAKVTLHMPDGTHSDRYMTHEEFARSTRENFARCTPDDPRLRSMLKQFRETRNGELAVAAIDRILSGNPPDALLLRAWRADALRLQKRIPEAREALKAIFEEHSNHPEALYTLAWCNFDEGLNDEGWENIHVALVHDPNHEKALQVLFNLGPQNPDPEAVASLTLWGVENNSWRAHWWACIHAGMLGDKEAALRCGEAAYRMAPQERDALFYYANCLNNMDEGEHLAALVHPKLPECKGDFLLKYVFAGAMKKLGLPEEAIRVLREALTEESEITVEWREVAQHFLDELTGLLAQSEIDPELHPGTDTLRRAIWIGTDEGPTTEIIQPGVAVPIGRPVKMTPAPGFTGSTGSLAVFQHGTSTALEPLNLGWFRAHEIDFAAAEPPMMMITANKDRKLEAIAKQGGRRLPVTWSLYRVPSMETEGKGGN
jgi:tetratricopeptide (TPR) repeat protein